MYLIVINLKNPIPFFLDYSPITMAECNKGKGLSILLEVFPDTDPNFLYTKAMELDGDLDGINNWIEEVMNKDMARDFPKVSNREMGSLSSCFQKPANSRSRESPNNSSQNSSQPSNNSCENSNNSAHNSSVNCNSEPANSRESPNNSSRNSSQPANNFCENSTNSSRNSFVNCESESATNSCRNLCNPKTQWLFGLKKHSFHY